MANVLRLNGFKAVKHLTGAPYNGQVSIYFVPASDATALYPGDAVKFATGSGDTVGTMNVTRAAAGDAIMGIFTGVVPQKLDPVAGTITTGSTSLDTPTGTSRAASTAQYVFVIDSPDVVFEAQTSNGTVVAANIGKNANHAVGSPSTTAGTSGAYIDFATVNTTATLTFKILGFVNRVDNDPSSANVRVLVKINNHQLGQSTGTAGV